MTYEFDPQYPQERAADLGFLSYQHSLIDDKTTDGSSRTRGAEESSVDLALSDTLSLWGNTFDNSQRWREFIAINGLGKTIG